MEVKSFTAPFRHWIISGAVCAKQQELITREWFASRFEPVDFVQYQNDVERKTVYVGSYNRLPTTLHALVEHFNGEDWIDTLTHLTGIENLLGDSDAYAGGIVSMNIGDYLGCHLDFSAHPKTGHERRLNQILYMSECDGGETLLYDAHAREVSARVPVVPWSVLVFENTELAYHGVARVRSGIRMSLSTYYYTENREYSSVSLRPIRTRALFVPNRGDLEPYK